MFFFGGGGGKGPVISYHDVKTMTHATTATSASCLLYKNVAQKSVTSLALLGQFSFVDRMVDTFSLEKPNPRSKKGRVRGEKGRKRLFSMLLYQLQNEKHPTKTACCFSKLNFSK